MHSQVVTLSEFSNMGKRTAWNAWLAFPAVTQTILVITRTHGYVLKIDPNHMQCLAHFVVMMYSKTCPAQSVNCTRKVAYC